MSLVDGLSNKLNEFAMVCHYCAEPFSPDTVNQKCLVNRSNVSEYFKGFCLLDPTEDERGSGFHFFSKPNPKIFDDPSLLNRMVANIKQLNQDSGTNPYK